MTIEIDFEEPSPARTLEELLAYDGTAFINCAYQTLLGRKPDNEGLSYYLTRRNRGISKIQTVAQLCSSPEIRGKHLSLPGLKSALAQWRRSRWPVLGRFFSPPEVGVSTSVEAKLRSVERSLAAFSGEILARLDRNDARLNGIDRAIDRLGEEISSLHDLNQQAQIAEKILGKPNDRFVFNLSTSHHWRAHVVGIVRVERELAKYLANYANVTFALWDSNSARLRMLNRRQVKRILSEQWCESSDASMVKYELHTLPILELSGKDTFISIGLDWDLSPMHDLARYVGRTGACVVCGCYDLVPILFPEFSARQGMNHMFKRHFVDMAHTARRVFAISDASRRDLVGFWEEAELEAQLPQVSVVPLAADCSGVGVLPALSGNEANILEHYLQRGDYVLYVSSLEARKNHRVLVNVWRELHRERGQECPQLIFVGMKGWGVDDLLDQIGRTPAYRDGKIVWLNSVSDALLAHLYHHCLFTVFPSMYEGWGLAASEAMSFGKVCVAASNSSLPEATQGLMPLLQPCDYLGWKAEITKLIDDDEYRTQLEEKISSNYAPRNWEDFSRDFCQKVLLAA